MKQEIGRISEEENEREEKLMWEMVSMIN